MFGLFSNWRKQRIIKRSTINTAQWHRAFDALPFLKALNPEEQQRLRELAILFIHGENFEGAHDLVVTEAMQLTIALQACLPILNLGLDVYDGWVSIIVYPAGFTQDRIYVDEAGVQHHVRRDLSGEAWHRGPVILAWEDVEYSGVDDGSNLVIHEFAHKLDMQNGDANGFPPLHREMDIKIWTEVFHDAFDDLRHHCAMGIDTGIDCYAATAPAEFFAVLSELFFMRPDLLQVRYPDVYQQLRQYYRQDPLRRNWSLH